MKYSLILPIYNIAEFLEKCFDTILSQDYDDYEVILVNDGSTDSSGEVCDAYAAKDSRFKVFHLKNGGVANARNFGLSVAQGDYIWFLDADDYIIGQPLKEIAEKLNNETELVVFNYKDYSFIRKEFTEKILPLTDEVGIEDFRKNFAKLFRTNMLYTVWNKLYSREFLLKNNFQFEKMAFGEDTKFNLDIYRKISNVQFFEGIYYCYIIGRPTSSANIYRDERLQVKKEEYKEVKNICEEFGSEYSDLARYMKSHTFKNVANNIVNSNMSYKEKYKELKDLYEDKFFSGILTSSNEHFNKRFKLTIVKGNIALFILLKKLDKKIKRIKK